MSRHHNAEISYLKLKWLHSSIKAQWGNSGKSKWDDTKRCVNRVKEWGGETRKHFHRQPTVRQCNTYCIRTNSGPVCVTRKPQGMNWRMVLKTVTQLHFLNQCHHFVVHFYWWTASRVILSRDHFFTTISGISYRKWFWKDFKKASRTRQEPGGEAAWEFYFVKEALPLLFLPPWTPTDLELAAPGWV